MTVGALQARIEMFLVVVLDRLFDASGAGPEQGQQHSSQKSGAGKNKVRVPTVGFLGVCHDGLALRHC